MATSFNKTYSITLKFTYQDEAAITESDLNVGVLRTDIKKWIAGKVAHINKGNLSAHIVGSVTEA
ncbi:unnamed protein product [marine sediment metagenome]|uniref:Uncharacterized protein n=1 Tax=marine sediment metagenome TaxID=412755 RepID=X1GE79_9ZZZZ